MELQFQWCPGFMVNVRFVLLHTKSHQNHAFFLGNRRRDQQQTLCFYHVPCSSGDKRQVTWVLSLTFWTERNLWQKTFVLAVVMKRKIKLLLNEPTTLKRQVITLKQYQCSHGGIIITICKLQWLFKLCNSFRVNNRCYW